MTKPNKPPVQMADERIPKQILQYKPKGCQDQRRSWKRWNEYVTVLVRASSNLLDPTD
jgi:hypothetical protein